MLREYFSKEDHHEFWGREGFDGWDEEGHLREAVDNDKNGVEALAEGEAFNKIHGDGGPGAFGDG